MAAIGGLKEQIKRYDEQIIRECQQSVILFFLQFELYFVLIDINILHFMLLHLLHFRI